MMAKHKKAANINVPMCLAGVLFCLTLFSFYMCGGLYAKYTSVGSEEDSARVARFDVSEDGVYFSEDLMIETVPGDVKRTITVVNNSEVAVACTVTIENATQNIPYIFSINGSTPVKDKCSVVCYLEPNSTRNIAIVATWSEEDALKYMGMVDLIKLALKAEQID